MGPLQMQQNANMANAQAQNASSQAFMDGLFGLGGAGILAFGSARSIKHDDGPPERILDRVKKLPVRTWRYDADPGTMHIGPYAEDWQAMMGLGDGKSISVIDAVGVLLQSVKDLAADVDELREAVHA
jgi:hypothetical protein